MTDVKYSMATSADYDEIIEHANFVFSYAHCPHEFKTLIPKAYGEARTMWPEHFIARENGRIRGLVGLLPFEQRVLDERLKVGFIGTVSVHPYSRGMGHMKKCMAMSTEYAHTHGIDIMALGGQRQRYEYYGYESGGQSRSYQLTATNCRHALKDVDTTGLSFVPFEQAREHIAALHAIYEQSPVAGARPVELFEQICGTWRKQPYAIMLNDCPTGYAIASSDHRSISELRLADVSLLQAVLKAYLKRFELDSVSIDVPPYLPDGIAHIPFDFIRIGAHFLGHLRVNLFGDRGVRLLAVRADRQQRMPESLCALRHVDLAQDLGKPSCKGIPLPETLLQQADALIQRVRADRFAGDRIDLEQATFCIELCAHKCGQQQDTCRAAPFCADAAG